MDIIDDRSEVASDEEVTDCDAEVICSDSVPDDLGISTLDLSDQDDLTDDPNTDHQFRSKS